MGNRRPEGDTPLERSLDKAVAAGEAQLSKMFKQRDELAALQTRLAEAEAQRAVLVAALEHIRGAKWDDIEGQPMIVLGRTPSGLGTSLIAPAEVCRQALATQPPSDLVALVKAVEKLKPHCDSAKRHGEWLDASGEIAWWGLLAALEALLTNQPGFRALIDREDV